jgi:hypothetical protein
MCWAKSYPKCPADYHNFPLMANLFKRIKLSKHEKPAIKFTSLIPDLLACPAGLNLEAPCGGSSVKAQLHGFCKSAHGN